MKQVIYYISVIFIVFLFSCKNNVEKTPYQFPKDILLSPVHDIGMIQGASTQVFISAIDDHLDQIQFSCSPPKPFIHLSKPTNGTSILSIDAVQESKIPLQVQLAYNNDSTIVNFNVNIVKPIGQVYYCDPNQKENTGKGTADEPFSSLENLMKSDFKPKKNSVFLLLNGSHGNPIINKSEITIAAALGAKPYVNTILFKNASAVILSGLHIVNKSTIYHPKEYLVHIDSSCEHIVVQNCLIETTAKTADWQARDWEQKAASGIMCQAKNSIIQNNLIRNVFHAIQTENDHIEVKYNTVDRFSGDAIRNIGSNNRYSFNLLKNAVLDDYSAPNGNHDDLFQSWTFDEPIENIIINNNIAISCTEADLPLKSRVVQGIACFDGFEKNWLIENNLVITDHPHGIALYGAENCKIANNIVLRNPLHISQFESDPWIMINNHKDGRLSVNNVVENNLTSALNLVSKNVENNNNTIIDSIGTKIFVDYQGWNFRLKE